jgi:hypothetical protein
MLDNTPSLSANFDSALLRIVPSDQVARANAAYTAHQAFGAMATTWSWLLEGALILTAAALGFFIIAARQRPPIVNSPWP